jgi:hypothetical protein
MMLASLPNIPPATIAFVHIFPLHEELPMLASMALWDLASLAI